MKKEDVLLRVPKIHYFRTRYREMSIPMALSSEIFIDETLKKMNHTILVNQELINTNYEKLYSIDLILKDMCLAIENIR